MAEKKSFVLRVSAEMLKELEGWANDEFRSINGQIEYLLSQALNERKKAQRKRRADK
ncbi:Arc family DNA binding domain-containing protein [Mucilaginibacter sp. Bleaf8]|uniref:Arc family DNA binding domain-containing protein n=1 Tax=Mucilaginibacter sp. Bleaf8 TaxID=2834430 RepID=UPI001BCB9B73|nr:Arc family DNA binding domain-containing protein [Mucilaginibacter sp. Bleaf8]MBS7566702.1 Arc family DNA binding domain-containing protein [Mucilaginibacter sp. Bleaf8]